MTHLGFIFYNLILQEGGGERAEEASERDEDGLQRDRGGGNSPNADPKLKVETSK